MNIGEIKAINLFIGILISLVFLSFIIGPRFNEVISKNEASRQETLKKRYEETKHLPSQRSKIWIDKEYGCHYFLMDQGLSGNSFMTPRNDENGNQLGCYGIKTNNQKKSKSIELHD